MHITRKRLLTYATFFAFFCLNTFGASASAPAPKATEKLYGVNRSGAEFAPDKLPGVEGVDFEYPADKDIFNSFSANGLTMLRVPILWERVQAEKNGPLGPEAVAGIAKLLDTAHEAHLRVILDLHNYGRYYGKPLTAEDAPALGDVWVKLLDALKKKPALFGIELMNEPHDIPGGSNSWKTITQQTINIIRAHNTTVTILAPGYSWQSARFWQDNNKEFILRDPAGKLLYAAHQYFDENYTGTYSEKTKDEPTRGTELLLPFLTWLSENRVQGIITEYGAPNDDKAALAMMNNMLYTVDNNDALVGALYWSTGPRWGDYPLSIEPKEGSAVKGQFTIIKNFPSRTNPPKLPSGVKSGNLVKFKNNPIVFQVEQSGLRPFATLEKYQEALAKSSQTKLYTRTDAASLYTVRWKTVEENEGPATILAGQK